MAGIADTAIRFDLPYGCTSLIFCAAFPETGCKDLPPSIVITEKTDLLVACLFYMTIDLATQAKLLIKGEHIQTELSQTARCSQPVMVPLSGPT